MRVVSTARDGRTHDRGQTPGPPDRRRDPWRRRQDARRRGLRRDLPRVARSQVVVLPASSSSSTTSCATAAASGFVHPHPSKSTRHPEVPEIHRAGGEQVRPGRRPRSGHLSARRRGLAHRRCLRSGAVQGDAALRAGRAEPGGDTLSPACTRPYEALPPRLKARLDGRRGVFTYGGRRKTTALLNPEDRDWTPVVHPIVGLESPRCQNLAGSK